MALDLGDLNEFFDGGMLATVNGKQYRIPPVSAELGLWGRQIAARRVELSGAAEPPDDLGRPPVPEGQTLEQAMLSAELYAELLADGVDDEMVRHMAQLVMARVVGGDRVALALARGEDPKAGNRAQRRAAKKTAKKAAPKKAGSSSRTTSTAKDDTTRKAGSGSGTTSPTKNAASAKRAASRGSKS